MDLQQIEKLVQIIENSSMLEFSIQEGDTKIGIESPRNHRAFRAERLQLPSLRLLLLPRWKKMQRMRLTSPLQSSVPSTLLRLRKQKLS